jgi:spermidine/putrescine transport system substrate-binding protein
LRPRCEALSYALPYQDIVEAMLANPAYDPVTNGHKWSMPYMFGTTGIGVRSDKVTGDVTSWYAMWDPKYKDETVMMTDSREVIPSVFLYAATRPTPP